jgi:hypothetical protein
MRNKIMGHTIVKIKNKYFLWSSIVDAPITYALSKRALTQEIKYQDGQSGLNALPERLERVEQKGTSSHVDRNLREAIGYNRAGPGEKRLSADEIYAMYKSPESAKRWRNNFTKYRETLKRRLQKKIDTK